MKTEFTKDGKEYFYNSDGNLVFRYVDDTIGYREDELHEVVIEALEVARSLYRYPTKPMIDALIKMQDTAIEKAFNYVGYKLLGSATYLDVFGAENEARWAAAKHYKEASELSQTMHEMKTQMNEMQKMMFNMAKELNRSGDVIDLSARRRLKGDVRKIVW